MTSTEEAWTAAAFGLEISGNFSAPGLQAQPRPGRLRPLRRVALRLEGHEALDQLWAEEGATTLYERELAGGRFRILCSQANEFLLEHHYYGRFLVSAQGAQIGCNPHELEDWRWQRFLVGQVLPLAAVLHDLEPLHASAVAIEGRAVLCMGTSGTGKTSTALRMSASGADLMTDDVAVTEIVGDDVLVHPGAALASVDAGELNGLEEEERSGSLRRLGTEDGEVRLALSGLRRSPAPAGAVFVLSRRDDVRCLSVEPLQGGRPAVLLGATFNAYARHRRRLISQLDVCVRLAESVPLWRVEVPPGSDAAEVSHAVMSKAREGA